MQRSRLLLVAGGIILFLLLAAATCLVWGKHYKERLLPGVMFRGQELGGMQLAEAGSFLEEIARELETTSLRLQYDGRVWELTPSQLGLEVDRGAVLQGAYRVGRRGGLFRRAREVLGAWRWGQEVELVLRVEEDQRDETLQSIAGELNRRPRNASLDLETREIIPGRPGLELDKERTWEGVTAALGKIPVADQIPLVVREIAPATSVEDLVLFDRPDILGRATTVFDPREENRAVNIKVAAAALDGVLLQPGQTLSFNRLVGPREEEHGFLEALELVNLELVPGIGGGVCQVSSTLFHAALLAGLDVVERHSHSRPSTYIPMGLDATVAYDYLDLKLANPGISPLLVVTRVQEDRLDVAIAGRRWTPQEIRLEMGPVETIPAPVEEIIDPTLGPNEILEEEAGAPGYRVKMERVISLAGREIRRETIGESHYLPLPRVIRIGLEIERPLVR